MDVNAPRPHHSLTAPLADPSAEAPGSLQVTIVLPCFNEQDHVLDEVERISAAMDASDYTYELLAIDDASTDDTLAAARRGAAALSRTCG